jgi:tetratricopeptide (TPR) repeat protein
MSRCALRLIRWPALCVLLIGAVACSKKPENDGQLTADEKKVQAEGLYLQASQHFMAGEYVEAQAKFDEVKKLMPNDPRLPAAEGELMLAQAKLTAALEFFEKAVKIDPKRSTNYSRIGYIHQLKGNREAALVALTKAIELNPNDFNAMESMGDALVKDGKIEEATKFYARAVEACPDEAKPGLVVKMAQEQDKAGQLDLAIQTEWDAWKRGIKSVELLSELGDRLVVKARLADAAAVYTEAAQMERGDPGIWEIVGELYVKLDKIGDAEAAFRESIKVKDRGVVHVALARLCMKRKDNNCLKAELDQALEKSTGEEMREVLELADLLHSVGRTSDAAKLVGGLAGEEDSHGNGPLQLKAAQLAKDAGDKASMATFCARAMASDAGYKKCP